MGKEKVRIAIPTSWNDISIEMYQKFEGLKKKKLKEDEFNINVICVICGIERELMERMEYKDINKIAKELRFLMKETPNTDELVKKVEWNGVKYGFIPNLSEITMGEYIDIEEHCKEAQKNIHKIMSVLYRPIVKETKTRYSIEPYDPSEELDKEFLDFPILPSMSALSFFFHLGKKLPIALVKYLRKEREKLRARA
tara:strand:- start:411 stop:1001 length:591 start_codon:yes stop_codon:yes gene_type:complete